MKKKCFFFDKTDCLVPLSTTLSTTLRSHTNKTRPFAEEISWSLLPAHNIPLALTHGTFILQYGSRGPGRAPIKQRRIIEFSTRSSPLVGLATSFHRPVRRFFANWSSLALHLHLSRLSALIKLITTTVNHCHRWNNFGGGQFTSSGTNCSKLYFVAAQFRRFRRVAPVESV